MKKEIKISREKSILPGAIVAGLLAAVVIYAVMIHAETQAMEAYEKGSIYVAAKDIPKGMIITEGNKDQYFAVKELDKNVIPNTAIVDSEQIAGLVPRIEIETGTLLTEGMFERINKITEHMERPVIAGFKAEDLYQVVGGVLRAGDHIQIYSVTEEGETSLAWQDIFVQQVFDNAGNVISNDNQEEAAQRINVYLDQKDVEQFYTELGKGSLRVVKICN